MKLSVIILNYNVRYFLELCLKSVQAALKHIEGEIIVVDNNSSDGSCSMIKTLFPNVKLVENKENAGFSKGNNIGVAQAKGEYICILNPDTVVAEDTFDELFQFVNNIEGLGITGCKLINGAGKFLPESKRNIPFPIVALKKVLGMPKAYYANHINDNAYGKVDILVGAFMFLKKEVFISIGGFDEDYFMYGEDIDLSYRIMKKGYHNYYFGNTTVVHFKGESTLKDKLYLHRFYTAMKIFYKKHFKKNIILDKFVSVGIQLAFLFNFRRKLKEREITKYALISDTDNENLRQTLGKPMKCYDLNDDFKPGTEVILDANYLSYKEIINYINKSNDKLTYKILPAKSNFILGSNNAISQGEVIRF